jgi:hypothetical protein
MTTTARSTSGSSWWWRCPRSGELAHAAVLAEMKRFLPTDELQFLMELSIEPVAAQLGLTATAT